MYKARYSSDSISVYSLREYVYQIPNLIGFMILLLASNSALAAVACPADSVSDIFSIADYNKLAPIVSPPAPTINQPIDGNQNESYLIASNSLVTSGSLTVGSSNTYQSTTVGGIRMFEFFQDFATKTSTRTVSYTFKNKFTNQSQALNNLSLTLYDIDTNIAGTDAQNRLYFEYFDQTTITGVNSLGVVITPLLQSKGAGISDFAPYRQTNTTTNTTCSDLDNRCRVTVAFDEPVVSVDITYGNNTALNYSTNGRANNDPGDQLIDIRFDGYCYKPQPLLTYTKELSDPRKANTDQFTVQIKDNADNAVVTNNITTTTTTGVSNTVTNGTGTTGTFKINPTKTYTLTEAASGTTTLLNYMPIYACKKSGLNGATITTLDPNNLQLTYGDDWTCTVTNGLKPYTFIGFVFNDNGGITKNNSTNLDTNTKSDISSTFTGNLSYFNGIFDRSNEVGIGTTPGLSVSLTDCKGNNISPIAPNTNPQTNLDSPLGQFRFNVKASTIANLTTQEVCLVQVEPDPWKFSVDTTPNIRNINLQTGKFDYKTEGTFNLDFGEVEMDYASLVLVKSQYVNNCDINANYNATTGTSPQTPVFSTGKITDIVPGKCIAYKIDAYNRGHVDLKDIQISDKLQTKAQGGLVDSIFAMPLPKGVPDPLYNANSLPSGTITSNIFDLNKPTGTAPTQATFYFNTKYGTTVNP